MNKSDIVRIIAEEVQLALDEHDIVKEDIDPVVQNLPSFSTLLGLMAIPASILAKKLIEKGITTDSKIKKVIDKIKGDKLNEAGFDFGSEFFTERGYLGINVKNNKPRLIIRKKMNNPYGGSPWRDAMVDRVVDVENLTKEYILSQIGKIYKDHNLFTAEVDELLDIIQTQVK